MTNLHMAFGRWSGVRGGLDIMRHTPWEFGAFCLQVGGQRFLAQLQLLQQVRQHRPQELIAAAHGDHVARVVCLGHDLRECDVRGVMEF